VSLSVTVLEFLAAERAGGERNRWIGWRSTYTTPKTGDRLPSSVGSQRGASMTDAELRIVEFLMTSDATRPADLLN
jgi:hypothetical protein